MYLIQDKEVDCGGTPPRVLGLDDYFMTEVEKVKKDPDTGRGVKTKVGSDDTTFISYSDNIVHL